MKVFRFHKNMPWCLVSVYNGLIGCTMMINDSARIVSLPMNSYGTMHDAWIGLKVANSGGIIDYISTPTVLYRQHDNNVIGVKEVGTVSYFFNKILKLNETLSFNKKRLKMVQNIRSFSIFKYMVYKFLYFLKK